MSFNELSRRELQTLCKEYGLPANKTNAAMASSLATFLGDPRTNVLTRAPAPQILNPVVAKNSSKSKALPKIEMQETSLAALILAARPQDLDSKGKVVKKGRDVRDGRNIKADLSAFIVTAPAKSDADCMLPKTTPLRRRRRNPEEVIPPSVAEEMIASSDFGREKKQSTREPQLVPDLNAAALESCNEDPTGSRTLYQQDIAESSPGLQVEDMRQITSNELKPVASDSAPDADPTGSRTLYQQDIAESSPGLQVEDTRQITSDELKPVASDSAPDADPTGSRTLYLQDCAESSPGLQVEDMRQITSDELKPVASDSALDEGYQTNKSCQNHVEPALSHIFRITADVDKLINRTTAMLEKFQAWKGDLPQGPGTDIVVG